MTTSQRSQSFTKHPLLKPIHTDGVYQEFVLFRPGNLQRKDPESISTSSLPGSFDATTAPSIQRVDPMRLDIKSIGRCLEGIGTSNLAFLGLWDQFCPFLHTPCKAGIGFQVLTELPVNCQTTIYNGDNFVSDFGGASHFTA